MRLIGLLLLSIMFATSEAYAQTNTFPADGNVGIGTTSPDAKLTIQGSGIAAGIPMVAIHDTWANSSSQPEDNRPFVIYRHSSNKEAVFTYVQDVATHVVYQNDEADSRIRFRLINTDTESNNGLNANDNTVLSLVGNRYGGGVGIKTSWVPDGYALTINGNALAEGVVVKSYSNWPDYVFNNDYKLPELTELETYIQQKGHLPGIPTKKEVDRDGQNLGVIQTKLLEKVEELTLYVIELKKTNDVQQALLEKQQKLLREQQKVLDALNSNRN